MRILLDCRPLQGEGLDCERSRLIFAAAAALPEGRIEWVFMADRRYPAGLPSGLPGRVVFRRALAGSLGRRLWYGRPLHRLLRRERVDMVWLTDGVAAGSMPVPFCLWMPERADRLSQRLKSGLEKAAAVVCYSDRDRGRLVQLLPAVEPRVRVLRPAPVEGIGPLSPEEKEAIKARWTKGMDYFLADLSGCGEATAIDVLKAFSLFKRRQQSGMRLILAGAAEQRERILERLKTYRYREDVDWVAEGAAVSVAVESAAVESAAVSAAVEGPGAGQRALAGAAYAVLLPAQTTGLGTPLLDLWKAGVPVIAADGGLWEEMAQGAVLGMASGDPASLAARLMRIYKEEDLRAELIGKGFERLKIYSGENFLRLLQVITEIAAC
ncbi:MAG TPA: hypothetical protein VMH27_02375 [Puia sp.]|nr:hypothetical protein [Puia sp.]